MTITKQAKYDLKVQFVQFIWDKRHSAPVDWDNKKILLTRLATALKVDPITPYYTKVQVPSECKAIFSDWLEEQIEPFVKHCIGDTEVFNFISIPQEFVRTILRQMGRRPLTFN